MNKILEPCNESMERNVLILEIIPMLGKLKIIALDIFSDCIVTIVDYNNKRVGLHVNSEFLLNMKQHVLKAKFKICQNNILLVKSEYKDLGKSNFKNLLIKYKRLGEYESLISFSNENPNKNLYALVKFTKSRLKEFNSNGKVKYQLKMLDHFVTIRQENLEKYVGKIYSGLALITWKLNSNGKVIYFIDKLFSKFGDMSAFEREQEKNRRKMERQKSEDFYEDYLDHKNKMFYGEYDFYKNNPFYKQELASLYAEIDFDVLINSQYDKEKEDIEDCLVGAKGTYRVTDKYDDEFATDFLRVPNEGENLILENKDDSENKGFLAISEDSNLPF